MKTSTLRSCGISTFCKVFESRITFTKDLLAIYKRGSHNIMPAKLNQFDHIYLSELCTTKLMSLKERQEKEKDL